MTALADINRKAHTLLREGLGGADYARFLQQFDTGHGDYTADHQQLPEEDALTAHQRTTEAKARGELSVPPRARILNPGLD